MNEEIQKTKKKKFVDFINNLVISLNNIEEGQRGLILLIQCLNLIELTTMFQLKL